MDDNCDGLSDFDQDGDGQDTTSNGGDDCDDTDPNVYLGSPDTWYDGIDTDCDGWSDYDMDRDGDDAIEYGGNDCDDDDETFSSTCAGKWYDGIDQNCDGRSDYDQDLDGFESKNTVVMIVTIATILLIRP